MCTTWAEISFTLTGTGMAMSFPPANLVFSDLEKH